MSLILIRASFNTCPSNYELSMFLLKKYLKFLFIDFVILLFISACENSNEPIDSSNEYMSLNVGDIRQYSMPYSANPEIHTVWKITGKTYRSDSTEVFIGEWYIYNLDPRNKRVSYYFIRDGFFYSTELEESSEYPGNPYFEQKLAKVKPNDSDKWMQIVGYINPDSTKDYLTARYLGEYDTPAGKFQDVYNLISSQQLEDSSQVLEGSEQSRIYYAKYWGHLGIAFTDKQSDLFIVNYMKIKDKEIGQFISMDLAKQSNKLIHSNRLNFTSILGTKQK